MSSAQVLTERDGRIHRIRLNRAAAGNAIDQSVAEQFATAVDAVVADAEPHIVVLSSQGTQFCVGGDVRAVVAAADPAAYLHRLASTMHGALTALRRSPHVVVAQVQGAAAGAGLGLVLNADIVVASADAVFLSAYAGVGLTPDCGVSHLLPRIVGPRRATELTLMGRRIDAAEALAWGLITTVVPAERLATAVDETLQRLAAGPAEAQSHTLHLLSRGDLDFATYLDAELDGLAAQIALDDTRERLNRFLARTEERPA